MCSLAEETVTKYGKWVTFLNFFFFFASFDFQAGLAIDYGKLDSEPDYVNSCLLQSSHHVHVA